MYKKLKPIWDQKISQGIPRYFKGIINEDFNNLVAEIENENIDYLTDLIELLLSGNFIQFNNVFDDSFLKSVIDNSFAFNNESSKTFPRMFDGCPNFYFNQIEDLSKQRDKYRTLDGSRYYFPWNEDGINIFDKVNYFWRNIRILSGHDPYSYENNIPSDKVINRIHIIQYYSGGGTISPHYDPYVNQYIQIGCVLNEYGKNFQEGGFCAFDEKDNPVFLEPELKKGSLFCFFPSMFHTVNPVDPNENLDVNSSEGRWFMSIVSTSTSDRDRITALPMHILRN